MTDAGNHTVETWNIDGSTLAVHEQFIHVYLVREHQLPCLICFDDVTTCVPISLATQHRRQTTTPSLTGPVSRQCPRPRRDRRLL